MTNTEKSLPDGFHAIVTPYLSIKGAANAIEFYKKAFRATEVDRRAESGGRVSHAEIRIGDAAIYLADEFPEIDFLSPQTLGDA